MQTVIAIGIGGFAGSIARYFVQGLVSRTDEVFPWGTFVVNVSGSFVLGFLVAAFGHRLPIHPDLRIGLTVGFLGAYTTFSTLMLETFEFSEVHTPLAGVANIVFSVVVGLLALWAGTALGRNV